MDLPGIMNHVGERLGVLRNNWQTDLLRFGHNLGDWALTVKYRPTSDNPTPRHFRLAHMPVLFSSSAAQHIVFHWASRRERRIPILSIFPPPILRISQGYFPRVIDRATPFAHLQPLLTWGMIQG